MKRNGIYAVLKIKKELCQTELNIFGHCRLNIVTLYGIDLSKNVCVINCSSMQRRPFNSMVAIGVKTFLALLFITALFNYHEVKILGVYPMDHAYQLVR